MTSPTSNAVALVERLRPEPGCCAFCGNDPYHYVDNGVGMERVAVTCCDEGVALYQHGDEVLSEQVALRYEAADVIQSQAARIAELEGGLRPFAEASDKLHSGYDDGIAGGDHPMSHVFVSDLRQARSLLSEEVRGDCAQGRSVPSAQVDRPAGQQKEAS